MKKIINAIFRMIACIEVIPVIVVIYLCLITVKLFKEIFQYAIGNKEIFEIK